MSPLVRYALFQLPGIAAVILVLWVLWRWAGLSGWVAMAVGTAWLGKDVALYPLLRRAYERQPDGAAALIGRRAVVRRRVAPAGTVAFGAEVWRAELAPEGPPIESGAAVRVIGARGLTLIVAAEEAASD